MYVLILAYKLIILVLLEMGKNMYIYSNLLLRMAIWFPAQTFPRERYRTTKRRSTTTSNVPWELPAPSSEREERCFWFSYLYFGKVEATARNRTLWQQIGLKKKQKKLLKRCFWFFSSLCFGKVEATVRIRTLWQQIGLKKKWNKKINETLLLISFSVLLYSQSDKCCQSIKCLTLSEID